MEIEKLYLRDKKGIRAIDSIREFKEYHSKSEEPEELRLGYHGYSIEFSFDGSFFYATDRDGDDEFDRFYSKEHLLDELVSYGEQIKDFLEMFNEDDRISDNLNNSDYSIKELKSSK